MTAAALPGHSTSDPARGRAARLAEGMRGLRTRANSNTLERALLITGGVLMPLGVLFIILGWIGASRTPLTFEQNDYLISGGVLGLALVVAGGFTYFAYWQTVRIRESRHQTAELTASLHRIEALLEYVGAATEGGGTVTRRISFVATPTGSMFHRPDCPTVAGRADLVDVDPDNTELRACRICDPLGS
jgi:hypothetical protein